MPEREYLLHQYSDASNLNARIQLHERFSTNRYGWHRWVFDQLDIPSKSHILELGCGTGLLWLENGERIPDDWDLSLSDRSSGMLDEARSNLRSADRNFSFHLIDAQQIPFDDDRFHGVVANHMLYHVPDRPRALSEVRRVLKPGGHLLAATNGRRHMRELAEIVNRFDPGVSTETAPEISFGLDNGRDQLGRWFSSITMSRYEDSLLVTDAQAFFEYALSAGRSELVRDRPEEFLRLIEREIALSGALYVTKDPGIFKARKDDGG